MPHFTELTDLADERAGGVVLMANDDFFAEKENLLKHAEPIWIGDRYTDRGKWMDGWESRRRRTSGHDFCVLRLGLPGVIRGVDINTAFFKGNFPEFAAIDACAAPAEAPLELLGSKDAPWFPLIPKTPLLGDSHNLVPVSSGQRWTHLRLQIFPDGGVARLRVHGEVIPDWDALHARNELVDLVALQHGGRVIASNDAFFGSHENLLLPGRAGSMKDGWETRRKRRPGHDWVILQLGARGAIESVQVDTNHFKGNFPDRCSLEVLDAPGATLEQLTDPRAAWLPLLPETKLQAHTLHSFARELGKPGPATHVRLRIYPDGGVSRLHLWGHPSPPPAALVRLNQAEIADAVEELLRLCGSRRWAEAVADARHFASPAALLHAAERAFDELERDDWLEAFAAHPRLGDRDALRAKFASTATWAAGEQAGAAAADDATLDALAQANRDYEARFGHIFLLCATGKSAAQMLADLRGREHNPPDIELAIAAEQQRAITRLRLPKLLDDTLAKR